MSLADIQLKKFKEKIRHIAERFIIDPEVIANDIKKIDDNIKESVSSLFFVTTDSNHENIDTLDYLPDSIVSLVEHALKSLPHDCLMIQNPDFYLPSDDVELVMSTGDVMGKSTAGYYDKNTMTRKGTVTLNWDVVQQPTAYVTSDPTREYHNFASAVTVNVDGSFNAPTVTQNIESIKGLQFLSTLIHEYGHHVWYDMNPYGIKSQSLTEAQTRTVFGFQDTPYIDLIGQSFKSAGEVQAAARGGTFAIDLVTPPKDPELIILEAIHDDIESKLKVVGDHYDSHHKLPEIMARMRAQASVRNYYITLKDMFDAQYNPHDIMLQEAIDFFDAFIWGYAADVMRYK